MLEMNEQKFYELTCMKDQPVLVTFSAPWCGYCRRIVPALKAVEEAWDNKLLFGKVDIDEEDALSQSEHIEVIPTLVIYHRGAALGSVVAPESRSAIEAFIHRTLGGEGI